MGKAYTEKLKDPRWQKKRLEVLERDNWACQSCGDDESTLHIHHRKYIPDKDPWDISKDFLITLCKECHESEKEKWSDYSSGFISALKETFLGEHLYALLNGFLHIHIVQHPDITASTLEWALKNPEVMKDLQEKFFDHIEEKSKRKQ